MQLVSADTAVRVMNVLASVAYVLYSYTFLNVFAAGCFCFSVTSSVHMLSWWI